MKTRLLVVAALAFGFALVQPGVDGGEKKKDEPFAPAKPGPEHKLLAQLDGTWIAKAKMITPGGSMESTGVLTRKTIMDGLYVQESYQGDIAGSKFKGMGVLGYDTTKKKYCTAWIDNFGTGIMTTEGTYDAATKTWTYLGEEYSVAVGGQMKTRDVLTIVSDDEERFEMYRTPLKEGKEFKVMEITYTRKKKS